MTTFSSVTLILLLVAAVALVLAVVALGLRGRGRGGQVPANLPPSVLRRIVRPGRR